MQLLLKALQHDTHPAAADHFDDLVLAQPPEHRRVLTRFETIDGEVGRESSRVVIMSRLETRSLAVR